MPVCKIIQKVDSTDGLLKRIAYENRHVSTGKPVKRPSCKFSHRSALSILSPVKSFPLLPQERRAGGKRERWSITEGLWEEHAASLSPRAYGRSTQPVGADDGGG